MKFETKKKKQLEHVRFWLDKIRPEIEDRALDPSIGWTPDFGLLIALEQLVKYLEMEEPKEGKYEH